MNKKKLEQILFKLLLLLLTAVILYRAVGEFYEIAWGTGNWMGEFSRTWVILYYAFIAFSVLLFALTAAAFWKPSLVDAAGRKVIAIRERMGAMRWLVWGVLLILPVWFFQYTALGFVFQKFYIRLLIWIAVVCLMTILASKRDQLAGWNEFLSSLILTASVFSIAASLKYVNGYPFSFGWSEGNRLWDYSILFGRERYIYPADKDIPVFLDLGRKLIGGLPFLFPGTGIFAARLWVGLTLILPYLLLGLALFRVERKHKATWLLLVSWTFLFLKQGPIHAPLVLGAAVVALAWTSPLWIAIPLVVGAGYFMDYSRFTWIFAPGIWIVMLEFASHSFTPDKKMTAKIWAISALLGALGIFGGFILPGVVRSSAARFAAPVATAAPAVTIATPAPTSVSVPLPTATPAPSQVETSKLPPYLQNIVGYVQNQPLLWYRLLPNSTYDRGILIALFFAITPLCIALVYLSAKKIWSLRTLQKAALLLPLLAFLAVGLVASTKIGGGGDLHNMDMFLIGLLFAAALAWQNGGREWMQDRAQIPSWMKIVIVAMLVNSSLTPLLEMRSFTLSEETAWLKTLTDTKSESTAKSESTMGMLPSQGEIESALQTIQTEADKAKSQGDVLFIDQRQLLTFGYISGIPLIPEYEKKLMMDQALADNAAYFQPYYADLAAKRFSLIVTEPLRTPIQDSSYQFGEENNAWVKWVANPTLCYYEPLETLKTVRVQLLVPRQGEVDCSAELPKESLP